MKIVVDMRGGTAEVFVELQHVRKGRGKPLPTGTPNDCNYFLAVASQWGIGGGKGRTEKLWKPVWVVQSLSSASEKTQPSCLVSAMLTANIAEKGG